MTRLVLLVGLLTSLASVPVQADPSEEGMAIDIAAMMAAKSAGGDGDKDKSPFPKFEDVTKGMEADKGLFTLWSYPAGAKDKDSEKLLCQIPSSFLGQKFMLSMSFSGGGFFTGFPLEQHVVQWEKHDKKLLLIEPDTRFVTKKGDTISDVVKRTHPNRIRVSVPIVTMAPGGAPVIDLGSMLKSNLADIAWMSFMGGGRSGGGGISKSLSEWVKKKVFEHNVEIGVNLAMRRSSPPGSYDKKQVHYSFWKLPETSYKPRVADDRVGYFLTTNQDWSRPTNARDLFNRYVDRWPLEKRDSSLKLCEPKQPIVYYIEKTVPVRYRRAVRDGILEWNKAFEAIGFVNAVEVRQQTYDNEWKDLDPEDMRYSFFRWIVAGVGFAMGPHRANPFTGEIYDADIIFDDAMVRFFEKSAQRSLPSTAMAMMNADPAMNAFFDQNPEWKRPERSWESFSFGEQEKNEAALRDAMRERMRRNGHVGCDYAEGMTHQMAVAHSVLAGQPKEVIEAYLYDIIKEVVMHEVGHTLGLRHNFKASTIYSVEEIKQRRGTGEALVGSVMDYNPALFFKDDATEGHFITPTVGPYDMWAIEYGYRPADGTYKTKQKETDEPEDGDETKKAELAADKPATDTDATSGLSKEMLDKLPPEIRKIVEAKLGDTSEAKPASGKSSESAPPSAPSGEKGMLLAIASRSAEPLLIYATDEDTTGLSPDPRSNRFDMSSSPIEWAETRMELLDDRMKTLLDWGVADGESWYFLRSTFQSMVFERLNLLNYVGRYIGGQYEHRAHKGDAGAPSPFETVDPDMQRRALTFLDDNLYSDDFSWITPEILQHLTPARWWHEGARINFAGDYPVHNLISVVQWVNLINRFHPNTLRRIHDAERKTTAANKFTVAEYLQSMQKACWSEVLDDARVGRGPWTDTAPFVIDARRSLQREYLTIMELLVRSQPGTLLSPDLHSMVQGSLRVLDGRVEKLLSRNDLDFASRAHLASTKSRIDRILAPKLDEY